ncbi:MAG: hypothetical protein WBO46_23195 [Caldilineaceae bacterium]
MSNDYQRVRAILLQEQRRRAAAYRYRPYERAGQMKEIADALAALDRLRKAAEWKAVDRWWQDKFD